jgi:hypothetical protein
VINVLDAYPEGHMLTATGRVCEQTDKPLDEAVNVYDFVVALATEVTERKVRFAR